MFLLVCFDLSLLIDLFRGWVTCVSTFIWQPWYRMGRCYLALQRYDEAVSALSEGMLILEASMRPLIDSSMLNQFVSSFVLSAHSLNDSNNDVRVQLDLAKTMV